MARPSVNLSVLMKDIRTVTVYCACEVPSRVSIHNRDEAHSTHATYRWRLDRECVRCAREMR